MNSGVTITEIWSPYQNALAFKTKWSLFNIRNSRFGNGYEMFEASWQKTRQGRVVKKNKYPRWKLVARLESLPTLREGGRVPLIKDDGTFEKLAKRDKRHTPLAQAVGRS